STTESAVARPATSTSLRSMKRELGITEPTPLGSRRKPCRKVSFSSRCGRAAWSLWMMVSLSPARSVRGDRDDTRLSCLSFLASAARRPALDAVRLCYQYHVGRAARKQADGHD